MGLNWTIKGITFPHISNLACITNFNCVKIRRNQTLNCLRWLCGRTGIRASSSSGSLVDVLAVSRNRKTDMACSSPRPLQDVHRSVLLVSSSLWTLLKFKSTVLPAWAIISQQINKLGLESISSQYIFCRLGSTASFRNENTKRIPDRFPLFPLVK